MKVTLGLALTVHPGYQGNEKVQAPPFIKSVELVVDDVVVGELYVHSARWANSCDVRAAKREARKVLRELLHAGS